MCKNTHFLKNVHRARARSIKSQDDNRYGHGFPPDPLSIRSLNGNALQLSAALRKLRAAFRHLAMTVLRGATWWEFFLQTSRSFLNQNFGDQTAGKPKF